MTELTADLFCYRANPLRVVDGDTLILEVDLGLRIRAEISCRVAGINTPEIFSGDDRVRGATATNATKAWLAQIPPTRWPLIIRTHKDTKSFDRYVADVYAAVSGESLADALRAAGY